METDHRPWGYYEVLSDVTLYKVKKIILYPHKRLSLQRHRQRAEHWFVVSGSGRVTLDGKDTELNAGMAIDIPYGALHRIMNVGNEDLTFIEIQTGDYFGEDDIERFEDDYGRV